MKGRNANSHGWQRIFWHTVHKVVLMTGSNKYAKKIGATEKPSVLSWAERFRMEWDGEEEVD